MPIPDDENGPSPPSLSRLFVSFLAFGCLGFGGPALIALFRRTVVEKKRWLDEQSFQNGVALSQIVPGAMAMQVAAYVGLRVAGVAGAAVCLLGCGLPAFALMMILSALYTQMHALPSVVAVFGGLQAVVVAIVAHATVTFGRAILRRRSDFALAALAAGMLGLGLHPILAILLAALLGLIVVGNRPAPTQSALPRPNNTNHRKTLSLLLLATAAGFATLFFWNRRLAELAATMFRIDLFAFGGGFGAAPLFFHEVVQVHSWMAATTFLDGLALGQLTPGPVMITATFVGYWLAGPLGGIVATVAIFLPSFLLLIGLVPYFDALNESPHFRKATAGILCCFVGLLLTVTIHFAANVSWGSVHILLAAAAFVALMFRVNILWVVLSGTLVSLVLQ